MKTGGKKIIIFPLLPQRTGHGFRTQAAEIGFGMIFDNYPADAEDQNVCINGAFSKECAQIMDFRY
ncbi:MAG: hypothetical protein KGY56_07000 [Desulfobacterales bacterium]|nr:hypothetical protein [Desulfobacterales bacterium]